MSKTKTAYMDKATIESSIKAIATKGKTLDALIQATALSCINHIELHGDVTLFNRLFLAMPKGARKSALTAWALAFAKLVANTGDNKKEQPFSYDKTKATNLPEAAANPWFDFAPDKAPDEVFDVIAALNGLLKKAGKATTIKGDAVLEALRKVQAEMETEA